MANSMLVGSKLHPSMLQPRLVLVRKCTRRSMRKAPSGQTIQITPTSNPRHHVGGRIALSDQRQGLVQLRGRLIALLLLLCRRFGHHGGLSLRDFLVDGTQIGRLYLKNGSRPSGIRIVPRRRR